MEIESVGSVFILFSMFVESFWNKCSIHTIIYPRLWLDEFTIYMEHYFSCCVPFIKSILRMKKKCASFQPNGIVQWNCEYTEELYRNEHYIGHSSQFYHTVQCTFSIAALKSITQILRTFECWPELKEHGYKRPVCSIHTGTHTP